MSELAEDFILQCRQPDSNFPPDGWTDEDLRAASLEVLDAYEDGTGEDWTVYFCLVALGHVADPEDLGRILEYGETMQYVVIRALRGFAHPDAIEYLLEQLDSDSAATREQVLYAIEAMDFGQIDDQGTMSGIVTKKLKAVRQVEVFEALVELVDDILLELESGTGGSQ